MIYRPDEILDLLDATNCATDIQWIAMCIHEYPELFPRNFYQERRNLLLTYAELFI